MSDDPSPDSAGVMYEYRELDPLGDPTYTKEYLDFGAAYEAMMARNPEMTIVDALPSEDDRVLARYGSGGEESRILRRDLGR